MNHFFRSSIRNKLLLLLAVTLAPALVIITYTGHERRQEAIAEAHREAILLVDTIANQQELLAESIGTMLVTLSRLPMVECLDGEACSAFFAELLDSLPHLTNIGLFNLDGDMVASGRTVEPFNNADSRQFRQAVASGRLAAGEYSLGRITRTPSFQFALPVYDQRQHLAGVIQAGYSLELFVDTFTKAELPSQTVLGILDHQGRRLFRYPPTDKFLTGEKAPDHLWTIFSGPEPQGAMLQLDGLQRPRLIAYRQLFLPHDPAPYTIIHIAVLKEEALLASRLALWRNLQLLGGAVLAALMLIWLFSGRLLLTPLGKLVTATQRLKDGDLAVRSALPHGSDELGRLAQAFDEMAANLEEQTRRLKEAEEGYRQIFEQSQRGIFQSSQEGRFYLINPAMAKIFGYEGPEEMLLGIKNLEEQLYVQAEDRLRLWQILQQEGAVEDFEVAMRRRDGSTIWVSLCARLIHGKQGKPLYAEGSLVDITARKAAEDEIKRSNAELEQFAYAVSHDMRQPLRMVSGHLELLAKQLGPRLDDTEAQSLHFALDGARRLDQMIVALLEYSRVGRKTEPKQPLESRQALEDALLFLEPAIKEKQAEINIHGQWPEIFASRDEITRLLQNLLDNALKYHRPAALPKVEINSRISDQYWLVTVSDQGIGIEPDQQHRLFQVFSRLQSREHFPGSGVGLALCRKIVTHHGGWIRADSAGPGQGSAFTFALPLTGGAP
ncbi:ATP-binding protein [Desulfurivibrio alkaliphilus]|uniref:histidine kinase n=1 Tax=Desulfurivibrio alkaliphilus (strain DSM 19089 / UNIQEM U267 / AHT2) TaxID=589865 RepID=D6Z514_DESAT|nr:ATP-binding protein [Desulfurivibrio alkaliphilus]ADH86639.1 multi-sensor signal transduction histidine kinase [Desulfurivibrio alkaliphilus AHT 2]